MPVHEIINLWSFSCKYFLVLSFHTFKFKIICNRLWNQKILLDWKDERKGRVVRVSRVDIQMDEKRRERPISDFIFSFIIVLWATIITKKTKFFISHYCSFCILYANLLVIVNNYSNTRHCHWQKSSTFLILE